MATRLGLARCTEHSVAHRLQAEGNIPHSIYSAEAEGKLNDTLALIINSVGLVKSGGQNTNKSGGFLRNSAIKI